MTQPFTRNAQERAYTEKDEKWRNIEIIKILSEYKKTNHLHIMRIDCVVSSTCRFEYKYKISQVVY